MFKSLFSFIFIFALVINSFGQELKKVNLFENLYISIPEEWQEHKVSISKYEEISFRPDRVYIDDSNPIIFQLSYNRNSLNVDSIDELRNEYYIRFKEIYPDAVWINNKTFNVNSLKIALIETIDDKNYNFIFFTSYLGKQVHFVIQSSKDRYEIDKVIFNEILNSLNIEK